MNPIEKLQEQFARFLQETFSLLPEQVSPCTFTLNVDPKKQQFGDVSSNAAMVLAKEMTTSAYDIAHTITQNFTSPFIEEITIAGPGFLNANLTEEALFDLAQSLASQGESFFKSDPKSTQFSYNIEFVSANPTGPLHFGHGRGGIIGDILGNILSFLGNTVTKEFYINDAGVQIDRLGESLKARCEQELGKDTPVPPDGYQGNYLIELAQECLALYGNKVIDKPSEFFKEYAKTHLLARIKKTLDTYGISFDTWFSEKNLHDSKAIEKAITILTEKGYTYKNDDAIWFKATEFGDDKDRVIKKSDGTYTYVAADIAYMLNKAERGFDHLIMILGHDHHGYVSRLQGIRQALGIKPTLTIILYQKVTMKEGGELVKMSKRAGTMVTPEDVIDTVGHDVARFFYLNRKADAQLEFDIELATRESEENPVFYLQYAYVRLGSILAKAAEIPALQNIRSQDGAALGIEEKLLLKKIASLKSLLESITISYQTHQLTYFALELADLFHAYYSKNRVINLENSVKSRARLLLIHILRNTFSTLLQLFEISQPQKM